MSDTKTVAISDACLALSAFHAAHMILPVSPMASLGFAVLGVAAVSGTLRFIQTKPSDDLINWHNYLSWLASVTFFPLVASTYCHSVNLSVLSNLLMAAVVSAMLLQKYISKTALKTYGDSLGAFGILTILAVGILKGNVHAAVGASLQLASAVVLMAKVNFVLKDVNWFHYGMMLGNIALMLGLTKVPEPIYYKPL